MDSQASSADVRDFTSLWKEVGGAVEDMRKSQLEVVTAEGNPRKAKARWIVESHIQAVLYRVVALADGIYDAMAEKNYLVALILTRALLETAAFFWHFHRTLSDRVAKRDFNGIYEVAVMHVLSGMEVSDDTKRKTTPKIGTLIDNLDRELFKSKKRYVKETYDMLSRCTHPNWMGMAGLYGKIHYKSKEHRFSNEMKSEEEVCILIAGNIGFFELLNRWRKKVERLYTNIQKISDEDRNANAKKRPS